MARGQNQKTGRDSKYFKDRVGERHPINDGYIAEIIECFGMYNCTVRLNDEFNTLIRNVSHTALKTGSVKNRNHRGVCGVGYIGYGKHTKIGGCRMHTIWRGMIVRCYGERTQSDLTYKNVAVCEQWHNYQNFAEWFEDNYKEYMEGWGIDKDILIKGNKIYSPETCAFVPQEINNIFTKTDSKRGKYPIGVHFCKHRNKFIATLGKKGKRVNLGGFSTPEEAFQAYKTAKEVYIKETADEWKELIIDKIYKAMYTYKVDITD